MKLWLLKYRVPVMPFGWDCATEFVVCASNETDARQYAGGKAGDEGAKPWLDSTLTKCREIGTAIGGLDDGVVVRDFWEA